jgi:hypothetical protein
MHLASHAARVRPFLDQTAGSAHPANRHKCKPALPVQAVERPHELRTVVVVAAAGDDNAMAGRAAMGGGGEGHVVASSKGGGTLSYGRKALGLNEKSSRSVPANEDVRVTK